MIVKTVYYDSKLLLLYRHRNYYYLYLEIQVPSNPSASVNYMNDNCNNLLFNNYLYFASNLFFILFLRYFKTELLVTNVNII